MNDSMESTDLLHQDSIHIASAVLTVASFVEIFRGTKEERLVQLTYLFDKSLSLMRARDCSSLHPCYGQSGELDCFFLLTPNGKCGLLSTLRLVAFCNWIEKLENDLMRLYPAYLKLQGMVVPSSKQNSGLGSRYLKAALVDKADRHQLPVIAHVQNPRCVEFFRRLGFEVVRTEAFISDDAEYSFIAHFMVRLPREFQGVV